MRAVSLILSLAIALQGAAQATEPDNLDELARGIAKSLERPVTFRSAYLSDWREFGYALSLASVWPRPEFREPLRHILHGEEPNAVVTAAGGLLNFRSPALRKELGIFAYDRRWYFMGCLRWRVGDAVGEFLRKRTDKPMFVSVEESLVRRDQNFFVIDVDVEGMTVPIAARALDDADLSTRLQAFIWLVKRGIVLNAEPLAEAWARLGADDRVEILREVERIRLGRDRLRLTLEAILKNTSGEAHSDEVRSALLTALSEVESRLARTEADRIIDAQIEKADAIMAASEESGDAPLLEYALAAWGRAATARDIERATEWTRSVSSVIRAAGVYALAGLDDVRAVDAVIAYLDSPESDRSVSYVVVVWERLREREWRDESTKWRYLRYLAQSLQRDAALVPEATSPNGSSGRRAIDRIQTLEAIAQAYNGGTGVRLPVGGVDAKTATATAAKWERWLEANDPHPHPRKP